MSRAQVLVVGFYTAVVVAFFSPALLTPRVLLPTDNLVAFSPWREHATELGLTRANNALTSDVVLQNVWWHTFAVESWARGEPPLWNPRVLSGQPFLAEDQNQSLYPPAIALGILPPAQWYEWFTALHFLLAMLFMHLFMRQLGASRAGSALSAVTFGLCGFLIVSTMWPQVIATAAWLPLLMWAVETAIVAVRAGVVRRSANALLILSGSVAMQFLAGHPEISFFNLATAGIYALVRLFQSGWSEREAAGARRAPLRTLSAAAALALAVFIGTLTAAAQLLPFQETTARNFRTTQTTYEQIRGYALPPESALAFLLPNFFGNPTHHDLLDLTTLGWRPAGGSGALPPTGAGGDSNPAATTEWGKKNFVEGTAYVGIAPLVLAVLAIWRGRAPQRWALAVLALISVLIAFGTPILALVYTLVPGYSQLHTPFRWVYPYSFAAAALAGLAVTALSSEGRLGSTAGRGVAAAAALTGLALLVGLLFADLLIEALGGLMGSSERLARAFPDATGLFSYEWTSGAILAVLLAATACTLFSLGRWRWGPASVVALATVDLLFFGAGFTTAGDPAVLDYVPPPIQAVRSDAAQTGFGPFRVTAFGGDVLPANTWEMFGLEDIRGYDSIIHSDYVRYLSALEPDNVRGMLLFSKIEALHSPSSLTSPLLDLLGVRYVFTREALSAPSLTLIHDGPTRVYRRETALPRVLMVSTAVDVASLDQALQLLTSGQVAPRTAVAREATREERGNHASDVAASQRPVGQAQIVDYNPQQIRLRVSDGGFLVLHDRFFPGWVAYVDGQPIPIDRADGLFRMIEVPPGAHDVVFAYQPFSWRIGLLLSGLGLFCMLGLGGLLLWQRLLNRAAASSTIARVAKNALVPMASGTVNKLLDLGLAIVMLRVLGPTEVGRYTWAVLVVGYLDILANFGLGILLTRDLARDPTLRDRYLGAALTARAALAAACILAAGAIAGPLAGPLDLTPEMGLALVLLAVGIAISNLSGLATSVLTSRELMEYPAYVGTLTAMLKVTGGVAVLGLGFGIVGLAAVSIVVNILSAVVLVGVMVYLTGRPRPRVEPLLGVQLAVISYPLMLNNLLATLFFRVDGLILRPFWGDTVLGWYGAAYRFIDGLNVIPSQFTLAVFPIFSRLSPGSGGNLVNAVELGLKALLALALPISVGTMLLAEPIVLVVAGEAYVPHSVVALQILIWFLPFSFVNSMLQYVLIAVDQQRFITRSFIIAAVFNVTANLLLIPLLAYVGAALTTIASELVLLGPFWYALQRHVGPVRLLAFAWRPAVAASVMAAVTQLIATSPLVLVLVASAVAYIGIFLAIGGIGAEEHRLLGQAFTSLRSGSALSPAARASTEPR